MHISHVMNAAFTKPGKDSWATATLTTSYPKGHVSSVKEEKQIPAIIKKGFPGHFQNASPVAGQETHSIILHCTVPEAWAIEENISCLFIELES